MSELVMESTRSFVGGMNDQASSSEDFRPGECSLIQNGRVNEGGDAECRGGIEMPVVTTGGILPSRPYMFVRGGSLLFVATSDGWYYTDGTGASWTQIPDSGVGHQVRAVALNDDTLIWASGPTPKIWDGSTVSDLSVTQRFQFALFNNRVVASGPNSTLYASAIDEPDDWTLPGGWAIPIPEGGELITGLFVLGEELLVFKKEATIRVYGHGATDLVVASGTTGVSGSVGCVYPNTAVAVGDQGACWLSARGIEFYAGPGSRPEVIGRNLLKTLRATFDFQTQETANAYPPFAAYYPERNEYWLFVAPQTPAATPCTICLVVNLSTGACSVWDSPTINRTTAITRATADFTTVGYTGLTPRMMSVVDTDDGFQRVVFETGTTEPALVDSELSTTETDEIDFRVRTRPYDFGAPGRTKKLRRVRLVAGSTSEQTATVLIRTDGTDGTGKSVTIPAMVNDRPVPVKVPGFAAKGGSHEVEIRGAGGMKVSGIEAGATGFERRI